MYLRRQRKMTRGDHRGLPLLFPPSLQAHACVCPALDRAGLDPARCGLPPAPGPGWTRSPWAAGRPPSLRPGALPSALQPQESGAGAAAGLRAADPLGEAGPTQRRPRSRPRGGTWWGRRAGLPTRSPRGWCPSRFHLRLLLSGSVTQGPEGTQEIPTAGGNWRIQLTRGCLLTGSFLLFPLSTVNRGVSRLSAHVLSDPTTAQLLVRRGSHNSPLLTVKRSPLGVSALNRTSEQDSGNAPVEDHGLPLSSQHDRTRVRLPAWPTSTTDLESSRKLKSPKTK